MSMYNIGGVFGSLGIGEGLDTSIIYALGGARGSPVIPVILLR